MAKRQSIGLGTTVTAKNFCAVAGWGSETVKFTATTPVVNGVDQSTYISEMNGVDCNVALADAPVVIQDHLKRHCVYCNWS